MCRLKSLTEYQKRKMARKIAYDLWELEVKAHQEHDRVSFRRQMSIQLRKRLNRVFKRVMPDEVFISALQTFCECGQIEPKRVEEIFIKELLRVAEKSIQEDCKSTERDD